MTNATSRILVVVLLGVETAALAVMSTLHLTGVLAGGGSDRPTSAGIAEAVIAVALLAATVAAWRRPATTRTAVTAALVFAIAGFIFGLSLTVTSGSVPDIAFHATTLPILAVTLVLSRRALTKRATL